MSASAIIGALISLIKAIPIIDGWFQQLLSTYIDGQTKETKSKIADAAALGARAKTDEERYKASSMWINALKRSRIS